MPTIDAIKQAVHDAVQGHDIRAAYLFGSYARGDETPSSDIDLRFLCGDTMTFGELYDIQLELERALNHKLDIVTAPPSQMHPNFYEHVRKDEVELYAA